MTKISEENFNSSKFHLLIANFEGPIDLLLFLARNQKVDLSQISITELAEQYINFPGLKPQGRWKKILKVLENDNFIKD